MHKDKFRSYIDTPGIWLNYMEYEKLVLANVTDESQIKELLAKMKDKRHILKTEAIKIIEGVKNDIE